MKIFIVYKSHDPGHSEQRLREKTDLTLISHGDISKYPLDGYLYFSQGVLKLQLISVARMGPLFVSFNQLERRAKDSLFQQGLIKAVGIGKGKRPSIVDGTAGLGSDSFLMASTGSTVSLFERNSIIYELLSDGLRRYESKGPNAQGVLGRMRLEKRDFLKCDDLKASHEVVYLDPMFPITKKSSLSKKPMHYLQTILQEETDEFEMISLARQIATKRIVVKRGIQSPSLAGQDADITYRGSSSRFDVYLL